MSSTHATPSGSSAPPAASSSSNGPILATGDWTKNLVHLAKTAELKKHALTLQLHTAHILSAHASLEQKNKTIQDLKEQKNKLESERARLLNCLREVNEDRDKACLIHATMVGSAGSPLIIITDGEYASAKADVDKLRQELGHPPLPSLQSTLEEKSAQFLKDLRLQQQAVSTAPAPPTSVKRSAEEAGSDGQPMKRPRGRPKGSKNSKIKGKDAATPVAGSAGSPTV
ncbi:hypothetical protein OBBRIDRAFT_724991 [Obba rivulosa]|uniref:Uncharacterized protein n=1 Tax=Obba rivulosa TaxID=1052685 RepID=A0A8E2DPM4_9APHY|nr:hypothetical protein OBBRIDRAFT_724991 [Obba rivulosa]